MFEQFSPSQERNLNIIEKKYPRIADAIRVSWGTAEGKAYLDSLIIDNRGERAGFSFDVISALMELYSEYKVFYNSQTLSQKKDPWNSFTPKKHK